MAIYCLNCGVELPEGVAFCDSCGTPVRGQAHPANIAPQPAPVASIGSVACPVCGAAALPGEAFCDNCGAALLAPSQYAVPTSVASSRPTSQSVASPPSYSSAPMPPYAPTQQAISLVIISPPPPATLSIPNRPELIVGLSDPQSNRYPDVDLGPYGGLDLGISRRHFRLARQGDQLYLEDLGSVNGTVVNGQRIPPHTLQPLRNGDRLLLGKMELTIEAS